MGAFPVPNLRGATAFAATELRVQLHEGIAIFTSIMTQAVLLIFVRILAPSLFDVALLGSLVFSTFTLGQRVLNEAAYIRVDHKLHELYLASPLTPDAYFVGISVGVLGAYLLPIFVLVAVATFVIPFTPLLVVTLLGVCAAVWVFTSSLGYVLSTTFRDMRAIWSYASILYNLFGVLPPVFYPISRFPGALRPVALVLPPSAAAALLQQELGVAQLTEGEILLAVASLVGLAAGSFFVAIYWAPEDDPATMTMTVGDRALVPSQGRALPGFALIGWRWVSRNPASAIAPIMLPFIFLYFLRLISPPGLFPLEVVGAMLFTTQNIGSWVLGDSATWRIESSLQDLFVASPMGKVRYLFGVAFSNLIPAAPALLILSVLLAVVVGHAISLFAWGVLLLSILVLWVLFSSVGVAISSRLTSQREIWPVGSLAFTILGMLSPLYYPLSYLPPLWQQAAHFLPATYAALLVQGALGLTPQTTGQMELDAALLLVCAAVGTALALSLYRWGDP